MRTARMLPRLRLLSLGRDLRYAAFPVLEGFSADVMLEEADETDELCSKLKKMSSVQQLERKRQINNQFLLTCSSNSPMMQLSSLFSPRSN